MAVTEWLVIDWLNDIDASLYCRLQELDLRMSLPQNADLAGHIAV